ncbi:hypothetical protein YS771_GM000064 [Streptococcus phage YS771]|nr:hypothetical protein YS771_GM000064 [Streptococcus phage YS771]
MKHVKLNTGIPFDVENFEDKTNKSFPYFQDGKKYALCPCCGSSVQIIGGINNLTQNKGGRLYAAHTKSKVKGLNFNEAEKLNCINYEGNNNNWQKIYEARQNIPENQVVLEYIKENIDEIASAVEDLIGFRCKLKYSRSKMFENLYQSFIANGGLCIANDQFAPEYIPRMIIERASPVNCWGAIPIGRTEGYIKRTQTFKGSIDKGQFKPAIEVKFVGTLDHDENPTRLNMRLIIGEKEFDMYYITARIN